MVEIFDASLPLFSDIYISNKNEAEIKKIIMKNHVWIFVRICQNFSKRTPNL